MKLHLFLGLFLILSVATSRASDLQFQKGDHICIIGNTLADRMQHAGWLEAHLQARFPEHELVFRHLGVAGDELELKKRLRSRDFGSPDDHLTKNQADVVFAFFGYNESFEGEEGLDKFKRDVAGFITHTLGQKYNGESAPRLVLFSPIAHENLNDPNLPDGSENNARLAMYTEAMAEVAKEHEVCFIDLFQPTGELYAGTEKPLTINGVHLNGDGYRQLAEVIVGIYSPRRAKLLPIRRCSKRFATRY